MLFLFLFLFPSPPALISFEGDQLPREINRAAYMRLIQTDIIAPPAPHDSTLCVCVWLWFIELRTGVTAIVLSVRTEM